MSDNTETFVRATELAREGKSDEAAALYRGILAEQPKHLAAAKALADLVESGAARGEAAAARKAAVDIETESTYSVAKTAQKHGRFDVAIRCYKKILDFDPEHGDAVWGLAEACYANDQVAEAL
ncbi:MAG TPA: hypothetical protein DEV64_02700, partial [Rhodospirillaceae bacterium]|nr:hypothetical protein [Rhodospirillaceae bacterium]